MAAITRLVFLSILFIAGSDAARILAYYPTPLTSHQAVFRHLTQELLKRGHELVVLTTDPQYSKEERPANLTEIDLYDVSHRKWKNDVLALVAVSQGSKESFQKQFRAIYSLYVKLVGLQLSTLEAQALLNDKTQHFDLIILEAYIDAALGISHIFKAPVIQFSSVSAESNNLKTTGSSMHPFLYPTLVNTRVYNLTLWEKVSNFNFFINHNKMLCDISKESDEMLKKVLGPDVPSVEELKKNVDMLFLNVHPIWDSNRPVPPNVVYLGGIHLKSEKELPEDLKNYLDSSKHGVIYVSFGTNADAAFLPPHKLQAMVNVFSKLPYDILWKWNNDELPGRTKNIRISKWLPQSDLLKHPKIKFFVTQGGMQSTDEAIDATVPLIGIPLAGDQWYNVEQYVHLKIGLYIDPETITEEQFQAAVEEILNNDSYRQNIIRLKAVMNDQPQTPLERAVWWTEYVIRHKGAKHLRSPAANMSWAEYLELELLFYALASLFSVIIILVLISCKLYKAFTQRTGEKIKVH